jgi:hypothetical protein
MKMLMLVYSGEHPQRVAALLDDHGHGGYTEFRDVHGAGATGRRDGSRAWPGSSTMFVSVVPQGSAAALVDRLRDAAAALPPGERLHVAVLPTESFF